MRIWQPCKSKSWETQPCAPVIRETGGVRKMRFAAMVGDRGSGGLRVCYVYFKKYGLVLLTTVYAKNEESDLTSCKDT